MDVLVRAGTPVELCRVVEEGKRTPPKKGGNPKRNGKGKAKTTTAAEVRDAIESEDETDLVQRHHSRGLKREVVDDELPSIESTSSKSVIVNRAEVLLTSPLKKRRIAGMYSSP